MEPLLGIVQLNLSCMEWISYFFFKTPQKINSAKPDPIRKIKEMSCQTRTFEVTLLADALKITPIFPTWLLIIPIFFLL